jgi:hypothetical protein
MKITRGIRENMHHKSKCYNEIDDGLLDLSMQNLKVVRNTTGIELFLPKDI